MMITGSRRRTLFAGLASLVLLSACGNDSSSEGDDGGGGEADGAFPVTIEHTYGETEIPDEPERVVSLGYTEQDAILAFDVVPVGVRYAFGPEDDVFFPWADEAAGDAEPEIMPRAEVDFEAVAALEPDLIMAVTAGLSEQEYETLSQIAPTVVEPEEFKAFGTPWQEQTRITGRALGQEERAEELISEVEELFDETRAEYPQLDGKTFTLSGTPYEGEYPFNASDDTRSRFFVDLGMSVPEDQDLIAGDEFFGTVSREEARLLNADVLLFQSGSDEERAGIEADPVITGLDAFVDGRVLFLEGADYDAIQFASVLSLPYLLENLVPKLADVVE